VQVGHQPEKPDDEDPEWRTTLNLLATILLLVLLGIGYFLMDAMANSRRALECVEAGRRNCGTFTQVR